MSLSGEVFELFEFVPDFHDCEVASRIFSGILLILYKTCQPAHEVNTVFLSAIFSNSVDEIKLGKNNSIEALTEGTR
jgi:metal-dependent HD superfamily phosphatase/phosphodiesterase